MTNNKLQESKRKQKCAIQGEGGTLNSAPVFYTDFQLMQGLHLGVAYLTNSTGLFSSTEWSTGHFQRQRLEETNALRSTYDKSVDIKSILQVHDWSRNQIN